jgi:hypothetical protein
MSHNTDNRQSYHVRNTRRQATGGILVAIVDHKKRIFITSIVRLRKKQGKSEVLASS